MNLVHAGICFESDNDKLDEYADVILQYSAQEMTPETKMPQIVARIHQKQRVDIDCKNSEIHWAMRRFWPAAVGWCRELLLPGCPKDFNFVRKSVCAKGGCCELVIRACLRDAREATGLERTVLHATNDGRPVYERMGYRFVVKFPFYGPKLPLFADGGRGI